MDTKANNFIDDQSYLVEKIKIRYNGVDGLNSSSDNESNLQIDNAIDRSLKRLSNRSYNYYSKYLANKNADLTDKSSSWKKDKLRLSAIKELDSERNNDSFKTDSNLQHYKDFKNSFKSKEKYNEFASNLNSKSNRETCFDECSTELTIPHKNMYIRHSGGFPYNANTRNFKSTQKISNSRLLENSSKKLSFGTPASIKEIEHKTQINYPVSEFKSKVFQTPSSEGKLRKILK